MGETLMISIANAVALALLRRAEMIHNWGLRPEAVHQIAMTRCSLLLDREDRVVRVSVVIPMSTDQTNSVFVTLLAATMALYGWQAAPGTPDWVNPLQIEEGRNTIYLRGTTILPHLPATEY